MIFNESGFEVQPKEANWKWGLDLCGYGLGYPSFQLSDSFASAEVRTEKNRLTFIRGEILEEWFINDDNGLEQGWIFNKPPQGNDSQLWLEFAVRGELQAQSGPDHRSVTFVNDKGEAMLNYGGLKAWDATGKALTAAFVISKVNLIHIKVDAEGAVYPVTIDPVAQQAYLKPFNPGRDYGFGCSVAASGDTVVVGAWAESGDDNGVYGVANTWKGAAYVFVRSNGRWNQQAYLKASNAKVGDQFGEAVAISGNTIVIGARMERSDATGVNGNGNDNSLERAGAAYVFVRENGQWREQAYLKASNTSRFSEFGISVAISGDTALIGASREDNLGIDSGAAYVFARNAGQWSQQAYLKASNIGVGGDLFGRSVAISGDNLVVGAPGEDSNATGINGDGSNNRASRSGAAYVFVRESTQWSQQAYLKAFNTGASDQFGYSVAVSGDMVISGSPGESSNATDVNGDGSNNSIRSAGAAYVFTGFDLGSDATSLPNLVITLNGSNVVLNWSQAQGYFLQFSTDLIRRTSIQEITHNNDESYTEKILSLKFFRLSR